MTRAQALASSLEWLELLAAAAERRHARTLLEQMQGQNLAQGADPRAWEKKQRELLERLKLGL